MAKRKIVWTIRARLRLFEILKFYEERNQNKTYSDKLFKAINRGTHQLIRFPGLGFSSIEPGVRGVVIKGFIIYYEDRGTKIYIISVRDCRQNPNNFRIK